MVPSRAVHLTQKILLAWSLLAGFASASDGVIEINQTAALAGGITASDAPGFPVSIDSSGSYLLTSELTVPIDTDGIEVLADDVSINLNGFTIRGPVLCSGLPPSIVCGSGIGRGIVSIGRATRVLQGSVSGFGDGGLELSDLALVSEVLAHANGRVGIQVGEQSQVKSSRASGNGGDGIIAAADSLVIGSTATANSSLGAVLGVGAGIASNVISGNGSGTTSGGVVLTDNVCDRDVSCSTTCTDADFDLFFRDCLPFDCDDDDALSFPGGTETCDGNDNDCDGETDENSVCSAPGVGDVIITEIMQNPSGLEPDGEWFELYNMTGGTLALDSCQIENSSSVDAIATSLPIAAGDFLVLGRNGDTGVNGGVVLDHVYSALNLHNGGDELRLRCAGQVIDTVVWDGGLTFPDPSGASMELDPDFFDATSNDDGNRWCTASIPFGAGDLGTPGQANTCISSQPSAAGDLVITEIMPNPAVIPDTEGEWFEVVNTTGEVLKLQGCVIGAGSYSHSITQELPVAPGGILSLARSASAGFVPDYDYDTVNLANSFGELYISCGGVVIDSVIYDSSSWPYASGTSMQLSPSQYDPVANDSAANWCASVDQYEPTGPNFGTPGSSNPPCP